MSNEFHNPYHFVPVTADPERKEWQAKEDFFVNAPEQHWSHSRYATGTGVYHGRITCQLITESPIFIGSQRTTEASAEAPGKVDPFELEKGKPAIPASTLRGLISSIAETASNSALRVLEDRALSYRMTMQESMSALGMIVIQANKQGEREYRLRPLALPTLELNQRGTGYVVEPCYQKMFVDNAQKPRLRVLIGPDKQLPRRSYSRSTQDYYYLPLQQDWEFTSQREIACGGRMLHNPKNRRIGGYNDHFCIGQRQCKTQNAFVPPKHQNAVSSQEKKDWTRGIVRIMAASDGSRDFPNTRKHEVFIPYPEGAEQWPTYPVPDEVVANFHKLADERTNADKDLPYEPAGTQRNENPKEDGNLFRLKDGDIVYFCPNKTGDQVAEVAMSSIWRQGPKQDNKLDTTHSFFKAINPEILPMNPSRECISPAEMVFGFVEDRPNDKKADKKTEKKPQALSYKSRVRFSHGLLQQGEYSDDPYLDAVTLKILDSPKPPSPALYFTQKTGTPGYIAKKDLNVTRHKPQGRKMYLHHRKEAIRKQCYITCHDEEWRDQQKGIPEEKEVLETCRFKQKVNITPLRTGVAFEFCVTFENLNTFELGMLCYALQPNENFRHKIGMGKPLGLGTVRIEPLTLAFINRTQRYCVDDLFALESKRYHEEYEANKVDGKFAKLRQFFSKTMHPAQASMNLQTEEKQKKRRIIKDFKSMASDTAPSSPNGLQVLEALGNPANINFPVHYPQVLSVNGIALDSGQGDNELENYLWLVENDKIGNAKEPQKEVQFLKPISGSGPLPHLLREAKPKPTNNKPPHNTGKR